MTECYVTVKMYYLPPTTSPVRFPRALLQALCLSFTSMASTFISVLKTSKYIALGQAVPDTETQLSIAHLYSGVMVTP